MTCDVFLLNLEKISVRITKYGDDGHTMATRVACLVLPAYAEYVGKFTAHRIA